MSGKTLSASTEAFLDRFVNLERSPDPLYPRTLERMSGWLEALGRPDRAGCRFQIRRCKGHHHSAIRLLLEGLPVGPVVQRNQRGLRPEAQPHPHLGLKKRVGCQVRREIEIDWLGKRLIQKLQAKDAIQAEGTRGLAQMAVPYAVLPAPARHQLVWINLALHGLLVAAAAVVHPDSAPIVNSIP